MQPSPTQDCNTAERTVEIRNPEGLHMRPAMQFVDCANLYRSKVTVWKDSQSVDGKSIMQVTTLIAIQGTQLTIRASGPDAEAAVAALAEVIESVNNETSD